MTRSWPQHDPENTEGHQLEGCQHTPGVGFPYLPAETTGRHSERYCWWELNKLWHEIFIHLYQLK